MSRIPRLALIAYAVALSVVVADQALKYWVLDVFDLSDKSSTQVVGPFWLSLVWNRGFSFGLLNSDAGWTRWALSAFALGVSGVLAVWAWRAERLILSFAIGFVMGGAIGNVIDRLRLGAVTDFLDFSRLMFPWVFNLADAAVNVGALLLIWDLFLAPRKRAPG